MSQPQAPAPEPEAEEATPKKKSRLPLLVGVAVVVLGGLGAGGWFVLKPMYFPVKAGKAQAKKIEEPKVSVPLGGVVVNLADPAKRYLKVTVELGVPTEKEKHEVEERKSQLLDLMIGILSAKASDELVSAQGKAELKKELLAEIRDELGLKKVARVYFTEFVIQ